MHPTIAARWSEYLDVGIPAPAIERLLRAWMPGGARATGGPAALPCGEAINGAFVDDPRLADALGFEPAFADVPSYKRWADTQPLGSLCGTDQCHACTVARRSGSAT